MCACLQSKDVGIESIKMGKVCRNFHEVRPQLCLLLELLASLASRGSRRWRHPGRSGELGLASDAQNV